MRSLSRSLFRAVMLRRLRHETSVVLVAILAVSSAASCTAPPDVRPALADWWVNRLAALAGDRPAPSATGPVSWSVCLSLSSPRGAPEEGGSTWTGSTFLRHAEPIDALQSSEQLPVPRLANEILNPTVRRSPPDDVAMIQCGVSYFAYFVVR